MATNILKSQHQKELFDTNSSLYVLSSLMRNPLLLQDERYAFCKTDFYKPLQQMVFYAVFNMAQSGVEIITPQDIDTYISQYDAQYTYYKQNKGYEFVTQCYQTTEGSDIKQFDIYYNRLKKFSMLRDLEAIGIDTTDFYDTNKDALNLDIEDEKLNRIKLESIPNRIRERLVEIENRHIGKDDNTSQSANQGMRALVEELMNCPEVGLPLDGEIMNYAARGARKGKLYTYSSGTGGGKALPNSTLIPLFDGSWKQVGEIQRGDILIDRLGRPTTVLQVFPQGEKEVYRITFKDGRTALCNDEHLWTYHNSYAGDLYKLETATLREIIKKAEISGLKTNKGFKYSIPFNEPIQYATKNFKLDPYLLGLLIGDGSFREQPTNKNLTFSDGYEELVKCFEQLGWTWKRHSENNYTYSFKDKSNNNIHIQDFCESYNLTSLVNKYSYEKEIPEEYLYGNVSQRLALLQGLLDTDGSVDEKCRVEFINTSEKLIKQVQQLCWSLGLTAKISKDVRTDKYTTKNCFRLKISGKPWIKAQLFRLPRKANRIMQWLNNGKRKELNIYNPIVNIEKVNSKEEMTCFLVDNDEHLFLMNDYIVTHNTRTMLGSACSIALPYIDDNGSVIMRGGDNPLEDDFQKVLFVTTEQKADEIQTMILAYVSGVNEKNILLGNYTIEEKERINKALDIIDKYGNNITIECIPDPSIAMLKARLSKFIIQDGIEYIFYDYIFSSPGLLSEFRDVGVREDVALMLLSNTLKEIAANYNVFIQSATQLNENWSKREIGLRDQNCIRGSKAIADKIDMGCIGIRIPEEERKQIAALVEELKRQGHIKYDPNIVVDIYKNRRGELNAVKIFRYFDYGTCRCHDLFVTDTTYNAVKEIAQLKYHQHSYDYLELKTKGVI